jgi:hypothetical protein
VKDSVPKGTDEINLRAFNKGWEHGAELLAREGRAAGAPPSEASR